MDSHSENITKFNKNHIEKLEDYIVPNMAETKEVETDFSKIKKSSENKSEKNKKDKNSTKKSKAKKRNKKTKDTSIMTAKSANKYGKKHINFKAKLPYRLFVNRKMNYVVVMGIDKKNRYSIPYKAFVCSTAKNITNTPLGTFTVGEKYRWQTMVDGTHSQYAVRIWGQIMLHSIPYTSRQYDKMEVSEYNKLGSPASLGCVRMRIKDIKWIYDNCNAGTEVTIFSKKTNSPIQLPVIKKIKKKELDFDPTDPKK